MKKLLQNNFLWIIAIGSILRLLLVSAYRIPVMPPDTGGYIELAKYMLDFNLFEYPGWRTPGYPFLLSITLGKYYIVEVVLQFAMNVITTYLLYDLISKYSKRLAFAIALFFFTLVKVMLYEVNILTETSSMFFVFVTCWYIDKNNIVEHLQDYRKIIVVSLLLMVCFLIRPMFIYLTPILGFFMLFNLKKKTLGQSIKVFIVVFIPFVAYFGWSTLNYISNNWFTVTTYSGINLAQTSVRFFDEAPDKHNPIKSIYLKHINETERIITNDSLYTSIYGEKTYSWSAKHKDKDATEALSIWRAFEELKQATSLTGPELSKELSLISKELILKHPDKYWEQVARSFFAFWLHKDIPVDGNLVVNEKFVKAYYQLMILQKYILVLFSIMLIPVFILIITQSVKRKNFFNTNVFFLAIVLAASILQGMVTYGSNSRFLFPLLPLIILLVVSSLSETVGAIRQGKSKRIY